MNVSERVKPLDKFYGRKVSSSALIEEGLKSSGTISEEMRGQFVTEQFIKAAKTLLVDPFVEPLGERGIEIPEIAELDQYEKAYLDQGSALIETIEDSLPLRKQAEKRSREQVKQAADWLEASEAKLAEAIKAEREAAKADREAAKGDHEAAKGDREATKGDREAAKIDREEQEKEVASAMKTHEQKFTKWSVLSAGIQKDVQIMEEVKLKAKEKAIKQRDADLDARQSLIDSLLELKKFLAGLMEKFPEVASVVKGMDETSGDPYDRSDMRACYQNLLSRYRKSEALDVATSVIIGIRDSQHGNESLGVFARRIQEFCQDMGKMGVKQISISDLSAIILISGMKEALRKTFLQSETTLALTLDNIGDAEEVEQDDLDDQATTKSKSIKSRRTLFGKTLKFVAKQEEEALLLNKLAGTGVGAGAAGGAAAVTGASGGGGGKKGDIPTKKEAIRNMKEAQQAFAVAHTRSDHRACYEYAKNGTCPRGDKCQYTHHVSSVGEAARGRNECIDWYKTGKCTYTNCRYTHPSKGNVTSVPSPQANPAPVAAAPVKPADGPPRGAASAVQQRAPQKGYQKQASRVLFTQDLPQEEGEDSDESGYVVLVQNASEAAFATRDARPPEPQATVWLGWDSMSSLNVAQDFSLLQDPVPLKRRKYAMGMGGTKPITHKGQCPMFGKTMSYIEGGGTPNLMSVGKECQTDETGQAGMVLFSASGAVRFRVTPELMEEFAVLVDKADSMGLVRGKAVMRNSVYQEAFAASGPIEPELALLSSQESAYAISHSMFASRIRLDSVDHVMEFMVASGLSEQALLEGIKNQSLRGLPAVVTEEHVKQYFKHVGKSSEQLEAEIAKAPLRQPIDHAVERASAPGAVLQLDNVDPSFSRMAGPADSAVPQGSEKGLSGVEGTAVRKAVVPSVGGYKDAVIGIDEASGYAHLTGRVTKKDPHKIVALLVGKWMGRWKNLEFVKADQEFITTESVALLNAYGVRIRQAVPGDHRRTIGMAEGSIRWIQEVAQFCMNRLRQLVKDKIITARQACTLWYHALRHAVFVFNFRPSLCDPSKTRYEVGTGDVANLSNVVLMPFGLRIMGKNLLTSSDGRGSEAIYIGPSSTVRGGILTYNPATERVSVKYAFMPINDVRRPTEPQVRRMSQQVYGSAKPIQEVPVTAAKGVPPGWEEVAGFGTPSAAEEIKVQEVQADAPIPAHEARTPEQPAEDTSATQEPRSQDQQQADPRPQVEVSSASDLSAVPVVLKSGGGSKRPPVVSDYRTRHRDARVLTVAEKAARPPKPTVPSARECDNCPRWIAAEEREVVKLVEEETTVPLPTDASGRPVRPEDAIVLRLIKIREYKWKPDPETGVDGWLECVRIVCDGSKDNRPADYYAETPDRTLLFLMTSIEASLGIGATGSDVTRAYLNAQSIDRNIVIIAPKGLRGFPRESLLNKGLYGTKGGALSWQIWIDSKMRELDFQKLEVCRGVYLKRLPSGEVLRAYRHSDDFRMSSADVEGRVLQERLLKEIVRMSEFTNIYRFLGCTFEYINAQTGLPDPEGTIVLVRQTDKVREMETKFVSLRAQFNKTNRPRKTPLPVNAIQFDEELEGGYAAMLTSDEVAVYQSLGGCIQWVTGSTRHDAKLGAFLVSMRMSKPRMWDMFIAVFVMDYLIGTADTPLVLGGPVIDPVVYADASFASLPGRRSIMGHCAFAGEGSGAIYASVHSTKTAVTSIWEAELMAGSSGIDTALYMTNACNELEYVIPQRRTVRVDNQGEVDWIKGSVSNKRSRHIDVRYYRCRQLQEQGKIDAEHVITEDNVSDILTKPLVYKPFVKFARVILGHRLVLGKGIKGIFEEDSSVPEF